MFWFAARDVYDCLRSGCFHLEDKDFISVCLCSGMSEQPDGDQYRLWTGLDLSGS